MSGRGTGSGRRRGTADGRVAATLVLAAACAGATVTHDPAASPPPIAGPVTLAGAPDLADVVLEPTGLLQERVRPPRRPPNRVDPERRGGGPIPPNRIPPNRNAPPPPPEDRAVLERRGPDADAEDAGMLRLAARLGDERPTGRGVTVVIVEADEGGGEWVPDRDRPEFRGIEFIGGRGGGVSAHATATARRFVGGASTAASGVDRVHLLSARQFLGAQGLRMGERRLPATIRDARVLANAWVGNAGPAADEAIQRIDVMAARDGLLLVAGLPNSGPVQPLLCGAWNVLQVGTNGSGHAEDRLLAGTGTGGERPRITGPGGTTSSATPVVAAAAAMLMETADRLEPAAVRRLAARPEVVTAALLAGARRENSYRGRWSDGSELGATALARPTGGAADGDDAAAETIRRRSPLDPAVGAGALDVDNSHRILSAGPTAPGLRLEADGWSVLAPAQAEGRWILDVMDPTTFTANAVWYRMPVSGEGLVLPNVDLELLRVRFGDPGEPTREELVLASDAVESSVEGLHVRLDEPGRYVLRVRDVEPGERTGVVAVAWRITTGADRFAEQAAPGLKPDVRPNVIRPAPPAGGGDGR